MALVLDDITGPNGLTQNVGGTTGRIRFCPVEDFLVIAKKAEMSDSPAPTDPLDLINISDDHTFTSPKGWYESYITRDTGKVDFTMNQDRDTTGCEVKFEGMVPGAEASIDATLTLAANNKLIVEIELADGKWLQIGSQRFPAELKYSWSSENNGKGERGWKVSVTGFETTKQYYTGVFTMHS